MSKNLYATLTNKLSEFVVESRVSGLGVSIEGVQVSYLLHFEECTVSFKALIMAVVNAELSFYWCHSKR